MPKPSPATNGRRAPARRPEGRGGPDRGGPTAVVRRARGLAAVARHRADEPRAPARRAPTSKRSPSRSAEHLLGGVEHRGSCGPPVPSVRLVVSWATRKKRAADPERPEAPVARRPGARRPVAGDRRAAPGRRAPVPRRRSARRRTPSRRAGPARARAAPGASVPCRAPASEKSTAVTSQPRLGQPERVASLAGREVERPPGRQVGELGGDELVRASPTTPARWRRTSRPTRRRPWGEASPASGLGGAAVLLRRPRRRAPRSCRGP